MYGAEREAYDADVEELGRDANSALEDFNVEHGTDMQVVALNDEELELTDGGKSIIFSNLGKFEAYLADRGEAQDA